MKSTVASCKERREGRGEGGGCAAKGMRQDANLPMQVVSAWLMHAEYHSIAASMQEEQARAQAHAFLSDLAGMHWQA